MINNLLTAGYGNLKLIIFKIEAPVFLAVNSLISIILCIPLLLVELKFKNEKWHDIEFKNMLLVNCVLSFLIHLSMIMCTKSNSPLTTNVVGCIKVIELSRI
ncbi:hypothetical protein MXB_559 [Myxobolus squamalis]|nr:hypothetical protein MXB_559 [Myxobolus squamalis]